MNTCAVCNTYLGNLTTHGGEKQQYCSSACRQKAYRWRANIPQEWRSMARFTRADGKRPIQADGTPASSTNPDTWDTFEHVTEGAGNGFGIMLGDGLACYDLDHILDADGNIKADHEGAIILERLAQSDYLYAEVSQSGDGLHIFVASTAPSWKHDGVEFYSHSRFIRLTGNRYRVRRQHGYQRHTSIRKQRTPQR